MCVCVCVCVRERETVGIYLELCCPWCLSSMTKVSMEMAWKVSQLGLPSYFPNVLAPHWTVASARSRTDEQFRLWMGMAFATIHATSTKMVCHILQRFIMLRERERMNWKAKRLSGLLHYSERTSKFTQWKQLQPQLYFRAVTSPQWTANPHNSHLVLFSIKVTNFIP